MAVINVILDATIQARCVHAQVTTGSRHRGHPQSPIAKVKGKTHSPDRELSMVHSSFPHCSVSLGRLSASGAALTLTGITAAHAGMPRVWIQVFRNNHACASQLSVQTVVEVQHASHMGGHCGELVHHHHDGLEILVHGSIARCNQLGQIGWHQGCSHSLHLGAQGAHELSLHWLQQGLLPCWGWPWVQAHVPRPCVHQSRAWSIDWSQSCGKQAWTQNKKSLRKSSGEDET